MTTDTLVLLLSEMYGIYFLSAVILLQSSLPRTYVYILINTGPISSISWGQ